MRKPTKRRRKLALPAKVRKRLIEGRYVLAWFDPLDESAPLVLATGDNPPCPPSSLAVARKVVALVNEKACNDALHTRLMGLFPVELLAAEA
jgi:hypothetical protein